jgi:NAD(P)-dependent dehydrogenase (short-subunit alcohol dehydrogenase family)
MAEGEKRDGLDPEELAAALRLLERVAADRTVLASVDAETRQRLQRLSGELARPDLKARKKLQRALLRRDKDAARAEDERRRRDTGIRRLRQAPVFETPRPMLPRSGTDASGWWPRLPEPRPASDGSAADDLAGEAGERLRTPRKCYVCKRPYERLHRFYDQLCPACGAENLKRRTATVDLRGRVALITGARVKIGYQAAILLLRAGCRVVALTRFPRDAAARYAREPDFAAWRDRLEIHGVDLRHTPSVERLCHLLDERLPRLDFQIHNACQTVRRPPGFYAHLVERERGPLRDRPPAEAALVEAHERWISSGPRPADLTQASSAADLLLPGQGAIELFPRGILDQDLQQVDLRAHNSWRLALDEVPTLELLEVLLVNATAPFVMTARLKALMLKARQAPPGTATSTDPAKHVVLVSAVEGQFYREHKTDRHPHTNMAKAALNMLVRTSAPDLVRDGIHLNAVDTGWVTDEDPAHLAARKAEEHAFSPPLDVVDGAARVVDPVFDGFRTGHHRAGQFFKDYRPTPW